MLTQKPHDEVAIALHDCDNNINIAVLNLLEGKYDQVFFIYHMNFTFVFMIKTVQNNMSDICGRVNG